jgi:hypothetical protein
MTIDEVEQWFGNLHQCCLMMKIASSNMTSWKKQGYIPLKQQFKIASFTEGELMPDDIDPFYVLLERRRKNESDRKNQGVN